MRKLAWGVLIFASVGLILGAWLRLLPLSLTEVFGFVTGAVCVLLVVEQNIWNFPVGIANNVFFIVLFVTARLYGDMLLQVVYIGLALHGWYQWLYGGANKSTLHVGRTRVVEWLALSGIGIVATAALTFYLASISDSAPFLDALTTVMSLIAQYMLNKKRVENWLVWIGADVIYIGLYASKGLCLTSVLYVVFIVLCIAGLRSWLADMRMASAARDPLPTKEAV